MDIHTCAAEGDIPAVTDELARGAPVDARDDDGCTPLMIAARDPEAGVEVLRILLAHGADVNAEQAPRKQTVVLDEDARAALEESGIDTSIYDQVGDTSSCNSVLSYAVHGATREQVVALLEAGADVHYVSGSGYSVLVSAMYRADTGSEEHQAVVQALIDAGTPLDTVSSHGESALSVASDRAAFAVVAQLLERGADPAPLGWTPLFHAVAGGDLNTVAKLVDEGASLDQRDARDRTPFLLSVHAGHLEIARFLLDRSSDRSATGRCGQTALMYAISKRDVTMLKWLIENGWDVEEADEFGNFPLVLAAQEGSLDCVQALMDAGPSIARYDEYGCNAMKAADTPEIVHLLAAAGEDLSDVGPEMRRMLVGTYRDDRFEVAEQDYHANKHRVFGTANPERMNNPLWDMMVRTRMYAYPCASRFGETTCERNAVWCFARFGHSLTQLPDGRYVEIGGEHEDHYDPDFCIYNDVVVHHGEGAFDIYGYPEDVFPPTDFHSATLVWPHVYVIGCLGYPKQRRPGETPVYRLHCETWAMERVVCTGNAPGWIYKHKAKLVDDRTIRVSSGLLEDGTSRDLVENTKEFLLDLTTIAWSEVGREM